MQKVQTWDKVIVTAWKWKWTTSVVLGITHKPKTWTRVLVKWVNVVKKAKKGEWFIEFEKPIHVSNVLLRDESSNTWSRVWFREGKKWKERFYKKSGEIVS